MSAQAKGREIETREVRLGDHPFLESLTDWPWTYADSGPDKVITVAAVAGNNDDWKAYYQTPWCGADQVPAYGNKLPEYAAAELFPAWAGRLKWRR